MPSVDPAYQHFWDAYQTLSSQRIRNPKGPQPIQLSEIAAYLDFAGVSDPDDRRDTMDHVIMLDRMYLQSVYEAG